nr:hypothetical protein [Pandoravirus massiliensis]
MDNCSNLDMDHRDHDEAVLREYVGTNRVLGGAVVRVNGTDEPCAHWEGLVDRFVNSTKCLCRDCTIKIATGNYISIPKERFYYYGEANGALPRMMAAMRLEDAVAVRKVSDWCRALAQTLDGCQTVVLDVDSREGTMIRRVDGAFDMLAKVGEAAAAFFVGQSDPVVPVPVQPATGEDMWPLPLVRACMARGRVTLGSVDCIKGRSDVWTIVASGCCVTMNNETVEDFVLGESFGCGRPLDVPDPVQEWITQATDAFVIDGPYLLGVEETARALHATCHDEYMPRDMLWMLMQCVRCVEASDLIRLGIVGACVYDRTFGTDAEHH